MPVNVKPDQLPYVIKIEKHLAKRKKKLYNLVKCGRCNKLFLMEWYGMCPTCDYEDDTHKVDKILKQYHDVLNKIDITKPLVMPPPQRPNRSGVPNKQ